MRDSKWIGLVIVAILLVVLFLMYGFQTSSNISEETIGVAKDACLLLCKTVTIPKTESPCLSNEIAPDWACDVANNPRTIMDDSPENQCESYRNGSVHHFVEVTPDCKFIRAS